MSSTDQEQSPEKLREFGLVMCLALMILSAVLIWKGRPTSLATIGLGALFLLGGLFAPRALAPIERIWMKFAEKLSIVVTYVIVTFTFFLVVTPIGLIMRMVGKDLLSLRFDSTKTSYWEPVEPDGPGSRPYLPY